MKAWPEWWDLFLYTLRHNHLYTEGLLEQEEKLKEQHRANYFKNGFHAPEAATNHVTRVLEAAGLAPDEEVSDPGKFFQVLRA